ncbi:hypothetical protein [uncultured Winogradskyella sp.]|uniref:hypothetical protein n=1 Tax=uncultured Winogradskyella sp. TaxID=395353 RepID=UPI002624D56E|nr:hypothetical protein [uncultured Winogradskyella sp.]
MFFIIFGFRDSKLKNKALKGNTICTKCSSVSSFDVKGTAGYFYLFWIPIIPLGKTIEFKCRKCGQHHFKETAPKDILSKYKEEPLRRPWWHFLFLAFLAYQIVMLAFTFIYFEIDSMIQESKRNAETEKLDNQKQLHLNQLNTDFTKCVSIPSLEKDSISHLLYTKVDFSACNMNRDDIKFYSVAKNNMILTLFQIEDFYAKEEADHYLFLKDVRDNINKSYKKGYNVFIGINSDMRLSVSSTNSNMAEYDFMNNTSYYDYPLKHYYENDSVSTYNLITRLEHDKFLYRHENITTKKVELDTTKLIDVWEKINAKFKFKYKTKITSLPQKIFLKSSESILPEDLRFFFKYQNLNGPFIQLGKLEVRLEEMSNRFYRIPVVSLKNPKYNDKSKRVLPVKVSPRWLLFYEDYTYRYAMDMLPDENGHVGQIIQLGQDGKPSQFVATDLVSFLEMYLKEKIPTDIQDWN